MSSTKILNTILLCCIIGLIVFTNPVLVISSAVVGVLTVIALHFKLESIEDKKQEDELDVIVHNMLMDVNENYIGREKNK